MLTKQLPSPSKQSALPPLQEVRAVWPLSGLHPQASGWGEWGPALTPRPGQGNAWSRQQAAKCLCVGSRGLSGTSSGQAKV